MKNLPDNAGEIRGMGLISGSERYPEGRHSNPLHFSHLENLMDRGAWWDPVHGVTQSWTQLKQLSLHIYTHTHIYIYMYTLPIFSEL